ncbi:hypothetical protein [Bordetella petrii]|uniref:hypothetical protein n=1 Tax=Bordetella petrii TaxID=94624 RepID=UPI00049087D0|nr:hypothetical protein [Bordetella petrii]
MTTSPNPKDDGGHAFPWGEHGTRLGGMSLRDAFAIAAAGHIWARYQSDGTAREYDNWREGVAIESYRLADEMLSARARQESNQ